MISRHSFGNEAVFVQGEKEPQGINSIMTLTGHGLRRMHVSAYTGNMIINHTHAGRMV